MKAAMLRYQNGETVRFPFRIQVHMVAARYGQTPDEVRDWPVDDFMDALGMIGVTA